MNKTVIFITFAILAGIGIAGAVLLAVVRPDTTTSYVNFVFQILGLVTVAATTFYGLGKANEKLEVVKRQTNGTLSGLLEKLDEKERENMRLRTENIHLERKVNEGQ